MPAHRRCHWCAHAHQSKGASFRPLPFGRVLPCPSLDVVDGKRRSPIVDSSKDKEAVVN
jgi:hypothetical protein